MSLINTAYRFYNRKLLRELDYSIRDPFPFQEETLKHLVSRGKNTVFGKEHGMENMGSIRKFQQQIPLRDYNALEPYIQRMLKGEENVLWDKPPSWFALSSGTSSARSLRRYLLERYARYSFQRYLRYPLSDIISYGRDPHSANITHRANITHSANIPHSANITYLPHQIYSHKMPVSTKFEPSPDRFHGKLPSGSMVGGSCLTPSRSPGLRAFRIREKFAMSKKNFLLDAFWEFFL